MSGKHHLPGLPPRLKMAIGSGLAVAFVVGMVLLVQSNRPEDPGPSVLVEPPRSAAVVSADSTPTRTVSSLPVVPSFEGEPPPAVGGEPQTRPPAAPVRTTPPAPAPEPQPERTTTAPRPAADVIAATYAVGASWDTGFIGSVEVRNLSDAAQSWSITVRHAGSAGVRVTTAWNATLTRQGDTNVFTGGPLAPGATIRLGFEATKQVSSGVRPSACSAQRGSCRVS